MTQLRFRLHVSNFTPAESARPHPIFMFLGATETVASAFHAELLILPKRALSCPIRECCVICSARTGCRARSGKLESAGRRRVRSAALGVGFHRSDVPTGGLPHSPGRRADCRLTPTT